MLPLALLALIQAQLIHAQQSTLSLPLNSLYNFTVSSTTKIFPIYSLPDSNLLSVSVALCANVASPPRFFVTNDTTITQPGPDDVDDPNVYEILLNNGLGQWTGVASSGGYLAVSSAGQAPFEIGVSDQGESIFIYRSWGAFSDLSMYTRPFTYTRPRCKPTAVRGYHIESSAIILTCNRTCTRPKYPSIP